MRRDIFNILESLSFTFTIIIYMLVNPLFGKSCAKTKWNGIKQHIFTANSSFPSGKHKSGSQKTGNRIIEADRLSKTNNPLSR